MSIEFESPRLDVPFDHPNEECGVVGVYSPGAEASRLAFFGLFALQHRGQESAGIAASNGESLNVHAEMGLVTQIFREPDFYPLVGERAIGHTLLHYRQQPPLQRPAFGCRRISRQGGAGE